MTEPVKRYNMDVDKFSHVRAYESEHGRWVKRDDYARLEQECERLRGDLALSLKVPSVAAMHSYLDTECAKQNVQLAAERDAALKQVERLRGILYRASKSESRAELMQIIDSALQATQ